MKKDYSNIFEAAAESAPRKRTAGPSSFSSNLPKSEDNHAKVAPISEKEFENSLEQIHKIQNEIDEKLDAVYERSGLTPKNLENYLEVFSGVGFGDAVRKSLKKEEKNLEEQIRAVVSKAGVKTTLEQSKPSAAKERKTKTAASRKRWLPMR